MGRSHAAIYRTVWRWHFYAGLIVAPVLLILAVTGAIYLFNEEINDVLHRELRFAPISAEQVPLSRIAQSALRSYPGASVTRIDTPPTAGRSMEVYVTPAAGAPFRVFVDPATGAVLGSYHYENTLVGIAHMMHGTLFMGNFGDAIVELAACWGFVLTVTGLYLWWPCGRRRIGGVLVPRLTSSGRPFWKSLHAVVGFWSAILILFMILTGLPWATIWGGGFRSIIAAAGVGHPPRIAAQSAVPGNATVGEVTGRAVPWTVEDAPAPSSTDHAGAHDGHGHQGPAPAIPMQSRAGAIGIDEIASILFEQDVRPPYRLVFPRDATGTYSAVVYPDQPEGQRTLSIDQYSGRIIREVTFNDYGWAAKAVEVGAQLHMGNYFGRLNQIVMLVPCIGIVVLSVTGPYMWWRRRPKGRLAAPETLEPMRMKTVALIVIALGIVFPLAGISLIVVLLLDAVLSSRTRQYQHRVDVP